VINDLSPPKSVPQTNEVQDNTNKADTTKLDDATKRLKDAWQKDKTALQKMNAAGDEVKAAFNSGLSEAPEELQGNLRDAEDKLAKAKETKDKAAATQEATPTKENEQNLMLAENDEMEAQNAFDKANQEVIESFSPDVKKAYDDAKNADRKAADEWMGADNELRAAYDALEKLEQGAAEKALQ
jgi:hypothetical protein